jgi:GNAT superfamily N-acetyltransferase
VTYVRTVKMQFSRIERYRLGGEIEADLQRLLGQCFPDFPSGRSYYKLPPRCHVLAARDGRLVGQTGIEYRVMSADGQPLITFGVVDLCVAPECRSQGTASALLRHVEELAGELGVDYIVLFADDERLYRSNGYTRAGNVCRWVMIDEHRTIGIREETLAHCLMYKSVGGRPWPSGTIDLLGHVF